MQACNDHKFNVKIRRMCYRHHMFQLHPSSRAPCERDAQGHNRERQELTHTKGIVRESEIKKKGKKTSQELGQSDKVKAECTWHCVGAYKGHAETRVQGER